MPDKIPTVASGRYGEHVFSPDSLAESQRLAALAEACDPATTSVLASLPIAPGGSCLEIGAGLGSIALWIADNLAPRQVVATGLDTQALSRLHHPALRVVRHDARADPFPAGSFDLIVARNVLCHLPDRQDVLARAIGWLAPGGWILIEDPTFFPAQSSPDPALRTLAHAAAITMAHTIGTDVQHWARSYPRPLARHALTNIGWRVDCPTLSPTNPAGRVWALSIQALATAMDRVGALSSARLAEAAAWLTDPDFADLGYAMVAAWGQRPPQPTT